MGPKCGLTNLLLGRFGRVAPAVAPRQDPASREAAAAAARTRVRVPAGARAQRDDYAGHAELRHCLLRPSAAPFPLIGRDRPGAGGGPKRRQRRVQHGKKAEPCQSRRRFLAPRASPAPSPRFGPGLAALNSRGQLRRRLVIPATGDAARRRPTTGQPGRAGLQRDSLSRGASQLPPLGGRALRQPLPPFNALVPKSGRRGSASQLSGNRAAYKEPVGDR